MSVKLMTKGSRCGPSSAVPGHDVADKGACDRTTWCLENCTDHDENCNANALLLLRTQSSRLQCCTCWLGVKGVISLPPLLLSVRLLLAEASSVARPALSCNQTVSL